MRKLIGILLLLIASNSWAQTTPDATSADAKLFAHHCSSCHALPHPKRLDWPHWRHMLKTMKLRMEERGMEMEPHAWQQIASYLKQHAR
ncbi:MAG: cytochrome c [Mariprofundales bacterium]